MKIGFATSFDFCHHGGLQEHIVQLTQQFLLLGHDVRVIAPFSEDTDRIPPGNIINTGTTIPIAINGGTSRINLNPFLGKKIKKILSHERFDIIHMHEPFAPNLTLEILRANPSSLLVATYHNASDATNFSLPKLLYTVTRPFLLPLFKRIDGNIAVSIVARDFVSQYFLSDYRIIPNGIDLKQFNLKISPFPEFMDGKQNILFVSRLEKRKGAIYLLQAIPAIRERHPNTRFIIAGEGYEKNTLQHYVKSMKWKDIVFPGFIYGKTKSQYFASSDIFCAPTTGNETMGIVLLEAMASGVPIVASNIKGYRTIMENDMNGLLTTPRNVDELAEAVCQLLENEKLRNQYSKSGRIKVKEYAWPLIAGRILNYYDELLQYKKKHHGK